MIEYVMHKGYRIYPDGKVIGLKGFELKPGISSNGYYTVAICHEGKKESELIHRMVANCYLYNEQSKRTVNHKNGIKTDNRIENLEWATDQENIKHAFHIGLCDKTKASVKKRMSKKVVNILTGEIHDSCKSAAYAIGMNEDTLRSKLCGFKPNKTNLKYASI